MAAKQPKIKITQARNGEIKWTFWPRNSKKAATAGETFKGTPKTLKHRLRGLQYQFCIAEVEVNIPGYTKDGEKIKQPKIKRK